MSHPPALRDVQRSLVNAPEAKITKIVEMVDAMADRGESDNLIAPLRFRLALLKPSRPPRFTRLLFSPLNAIIVPATEWRLGCATVPRSTIPVISAAVRAGLAGGPDIQDLIDDSFVGDGPALVAVGASLWGQAAHALAGMQACPDWQEASGLPASAWPEIRDTISAVLRIAERVLGDGGAVFRSDATLAALLNDVAQNPPLAMDAAMSVLVAISPEIERLLFAASRHSEPMSVCSKAAVSRYLDMLPDILETVIERGPIAAGLDKALSVGSFFQAVGATKAVSHSRLTTARSKAGEQCVARLTSGLADDVLATVLMPGAKPDRRTITESETTARYLVGLAQAGRGLGQSVQIEQALEQVWKRLLQLGPDDSGRTDRARLAEILFSSDRAATLL